MMEVMMSAMTQNIIMRRFALTILLGFSLQAAAFPQQATFRVQGVVVRDDSGDPLSKARVELRGGSSEPTTVTTDGDGKFYFSNIPAGNYDISVRRDGFAPAEVGQKWPGGPGVPLQLSSAKPVPSLVVRMVTASAISGRVTESNGQPL